MKYSFTLFLMVLLLLSGISACQKDDDFIPDWLYVTNYSDFDITLKNTKGEADVILKKGERKEIPSKYGLYYNIVPNEPTTKIFEFMTMFGGVVEIYSYDYKMEYVIEGTAEKADIELQNPSGATVSYKNVSLPVKYQFRNFCNCEASAIVKRVGSTGNVKVSLYKRDRYIMAATTQDNQPAVVLIDRWW